MNRVEKKQRLDEMIADLDSFADLLAYHYQFLMAIEVRNAAIALMRANELLRQEAEQAES